MKMDKLLGTQMFEGTILRVTLLPFYDRKCCDERVRGINLSETAHFSSDE